MARSYTVATAALTLGTTVKWLDNVLSHNPVSGIHPKRQGISRRLTIEAILVLEVALLLIQDLGLPISHAVGVAEAIVGTGGGRYRSPHGLNVEVGLTQLRENLLQRLEAAVETAPIPRRGRPPANKTGRLV
jgi:hypothetical protein